MTNSGLQWAQPQTFKSPDKSQDFKQTPFVDNTAAMGNAIKESIAANEKITQQIIKNIEVGQKQREEVLDFWTKLAPKATGQLVSAARSIKEGNELFGGITKHQATLQGPDDDVDTIKAQKGQDVIEDSAKELGLVFERNGEYELASQALNHNNKKEREQIKATFITSLRDSVHSVSGDREFKIDGQVYTLNGETPGHIKLELRRRIDVSAATYLYNLTDSEGQRLFSKREVINDFLRPAMEANRQQLVLDTAEDTKQAKINLAQQKREFSIAEINKGNYSVIPEAFANFKLANPESEISISQYAETWMSDMISLAEIGEEGGGVDAHQLLQAIRQPYTWNDGTVYQGGIVEAFNKRRDGKGSEWEGAIEGVIAAKLQAREDGWKATAQSIESQLIADLSNATSPAEEEQIMAKFTQEESVRNKDPVTNRIGNYYSTRMKTIMTNGGMFEESNNLYTKLRTQYITSKVPVSPYEMAKLLPYHQELLAEQFGGMPWTTATTTQILNEFSDNSILKPELLRTVLSTQKISTIPANLKSNLDKELVNLVALEYPKHVKDNDPEVAIRLATAAVIKNFNDEYLVDINSPNKQLRIAAEQKLANKINELGRPGFGEQKSLSELQLLSAQKEKFRTQILRPNNYEQNIALFNSEGRLVGEDDKVLGQLYQWVSSEGKSSVPNLYKQWSASSGIPVEAILLNRALKLSGDINTEDTSDSYLTNIKTISGNLVLDNKYIGRLNKARSFNEGVQYLINPSALADGAVYERHYHPLALQTEKLEGKTKYDYVSTSDESTVFEDDKSLSQHTIGELEQIFSQDGPHYNIGAFAITDENTYNRLAASLYQKGLIDGNTKFDQATQELFLQEAAIQAAERSSQYNGFGWKSTSFSKDELIECKLDTQQFAVTEAIANACKEQLTK